MVESELSFGITWDLKCFKKIPHLEGPLRIGLWDPFQVA